MAEKLRSELQQLSSVQLRNLLRTTGHGQLLQSEVYNKDKQVAVSKVEEQFVLDAKNEGNALFRRGFMNDAVSAYSRSLHVAICLKVDPSNAVCLSNRAAAYLELKQFDLAIIDCTKAIKETPMIKPFMRRATSYIAVQQFRQAVADLEAALEFEPRNKECHAKLQSIVDIATDVRQRAGASTEFRKAAIQAALIVSVREGWTKSAVRGNPGPAAVNGHTLFSGADGRIYLFGGRAVREQKPDLFVLDENDNSSWDIIPTRGTSAPSSRAWHSTSSIGHENRELYCIYGGVSSRGEDSSVHLLEHDALRGYQWLQLRCLQDSSEIPAPRSGHATVSVVESTGNRAVFIFGGRTKRGVNDQLLVLRCSSLPAVADSSCVVDTTVVWSEICQEKSVEKHLNWPSARDGHSMCLLQRSECHSPRLILFGGNGQFNDERMNDVWTYDVEKQLWTLLHCFGDIPPPRSYHTAHTIGEFLFVVGGRIAESEDNTVYMLDIGTCEWFKVPVPNDHRLAPRAWHSSVLTDGGKLFVLGGGSYHGPLKDAALLDLGYFQSKASLLFHRHDDKFVLDK
ncbi:hypothetical protein DD238_006354 [Peronospora effusa]|uniref:Uncharacterized protein n=1 Tax=Peronospora effusa TaxID=542832 RepID=A0A3M6VHB8_9STRA|nr:hypothetical protein DD238_006354 [Peronospora effusa]RQM13040.1 hypothetical protein DD237_006705 [Peronospora effusa]